MKEGKSEEDEEEGNECCRGMEKVLDGRKKWEEEGGWPEIQKILNFDS